ncbi:hypothetical protein SAMN05216517_104295 [Janthinobacterium sp. OK676]|uniref:hypothetical protein n=1 Tax=unclassified Janthinobacterium TaxID=2610881 RepID=UPI000884A2A2|nr:MULTISPECIES: hypothetical protein [unclassified Janthinobacterium]PJJ17132.1 hypothetical protein CLU90_0304 [Janthinobacterium sp. 67]SDM43752.1 hypothetical protein SAMN05216517_104295 [Janthinobacterium sp. OK676]
MIDLHYLLTLRHPRRFWCGALLIAVASAILLDPWLDSMPWLVAIPFVAGGLLVALGELWDEISGKQLSNGNDDTHAPCRHP